MNPNPFDRPSRRLILLGHVGTLLIATVARSGTYSQSFTFPDGTTNLGDNPASTIAGNVAGIASVQGNALRLTSDTTASTTATFKLPRLDTGKEVTEFTVSFQLKLVKADPAAAPGEGFSLNFGAIPSNNGTGENGFVMTNGLTVSWDASDPTGDGPFIRVLANANNVRTVLASNFNPAGTTFNGVPNFFYDGQFHPVVISWNVFDGLDLTYDGQVLMTNIPTPGFSPAVNNFFAFSARTSATLNQGVFIDDLSVTTTPFAPLETGGPVITELMADNEDTRVDEECQPGPWIEIYNGQNLAVDLAGWTLTDDPLDPGKWTLPSVQMAAYGYLLIWADGKNRSVGTNHHASFALKNQGGYLALSKPDGTPTSQYSYPPQVADVSYGILRPEAIKGYFETSTPGLKNAGLQADGPPSNEDVNFSQTGGLLAGPITLTATPPLASGAVLRYTLNNSRPNVASPVWPAAGIVLNSPGTPGAINTSVNIRAAVFEPGRLPGQISSRTFIPLDASLTNYRNSGQPFSSNLPIIVFDSFGTMIDTAGGSPGLRAFQYAYGISIDRDPASGNKALITGQIDHQGRSGVHIRGETSAGFAQKPYAWELWDNYEKDKDESVLGLTPDSDWILISNHNDKSVLRNLLPFDTMLDQNGEGSAMREKYVEVFFRQRTTPGALSYADYRGIYVFTEKIKRQQNRVNIEKLEPCDSVFTNNPAVDDVARISGGYIIRKDKASPEPAFSTTGGQSLQVIEPQLPTSAQTNYIRGYMNRFEAALNGASSADPVNGYARYIDVPSFIDNHLWVEIYKQIDGYRLSTYYAKDRAGKLRSRPLWDYNLCLGNADYNGGHDPTGWYYNVYINTGTGEYPWYQRLFTDPEFTLKYWDRYWRLRRAMFSTPNIMARIDAMVAELSDNKPVIQVSNGTGTFSTTNPTGGNTPSVENPIGRNHARWQRLGLDDWPNGDGWNLRTRWNPTTLLDPATVTPTTNVASVTTEVNHVKAWLIRRLMWMDDQSMTFNTTNRNYKPPYFNQYGGPVAPGFQLRISNPNAGGATQTVYYTTDGTDPRAGGGTAVLTPTTTFVDHAGTCDYLVPSAANGGSTLTVANWTGLTAPPNDANWNHAAPMGLGFRPAAGADPFGTFTPFIGTSTQTEMLNVNGSCYLRVPFTVTQAQIDTLTSLRLRLRYDDGCVAYINGTEAARKVFSAAGVPSWNSTSGGSHADNLAIVFEDIDITARTNLLQPGTNVLAIHAMNATAAQNDFLIQPRLEAGFGAVVTLNTAANVKARVFDTANSLWSPLTDANFVVSTVPASAANVVISEIHYNPIDPTPAEVAAGVNASNDFEFIEIMNISGGTVDLTNCRFTEGITFEWFNAPANVQTLGAGQRMIICENQTAFNLRHAASGAVVAGAFGGNLSNGGEAIRFIDSAGADIKYFVYDDDPPWPKDADGPQYDTSVPPTLIGGGYSLVLVNPPSNPDHNLAVNWRSSATIHGNPGASSYLPFTGSPTGDTDGDGIPDLIEYATGPAPGGSESNLPVVGSGLFNVDNVTDTYMTFTFSRSLNAGNVNVTPEVSPDLISWSNGSPVLTYIGSQNNGDGTETVFWRSSQPASLMPPFLFARLSVSQL